jgi:hypothetical protein
VSIPPSPPEDPAAPPEDAPEREPAGECPRCGTAYEPGQEYCLECGLHLPVRAGIVAALGAAWQRRMPWYPGDWIWPVLLALVIAAGGSAAAIVYSTGQKRTQTFVATPVVHPTTPSVPEQPPPPSSTAPTTTTAAQPPPPPPARRGLIAWPAGVSGYTVVLTSVPVNSGGPGANAQARRALAAGLSRVGVLDSSQYSSLHPGYFVIFSGVYSSASDAQTAANRAHSRGYGAAYVRRITP